LFEQIGFFDERLVRNQDYEFNRRIRASGRTVWLNPAIQCRYFNQPSVSSFLRKQFWWEGPYNPYLWYLAPYAFAWRHAITGIFSAGVVVGLAGAAINKAIGMTYGSVLSLYALGALSSSAQQAIRYREIRHALFLPFCFFAYHFVHGLGIWRGLILLAFRRAPVQRRSQPSSDQSGPHGRGIDGHAPKVQTRSAVDRAPQS
jgi:hypothetical protein